MIVLPPLLEEHGQMEHLLNLDQLKNYIEFLQHKLVSHHIQLDMVTYQFVLQKLNIVFQLIQI